MVSNDGAVKVSPELMVSADVEALLPDANDTPPVPESVTLLNAEVEVAPEMV